MCPVEYFNPFRNVQIDPSVSLEELARVAHSLGEVVGLGLRNLANCPVEMNLMPESTLRWQAFNEKKPYFIATVVQFGGWWRSRSDFCLKNSRSPRRRKSQGFDPQVTQMQAQVRHVQAGLFASCRQAQKRSGPDHDVDGGAILLGRCAGAIARRAHPFGRRDEEKIVRAKTERGSWHLD